MTKQKQSIVIFELANRILAFLDRCSRQKTWPWLVLLGAILISVFCWVPYYTPVSDFIKTPCGEAKTWWLEHPFKAVPVEQFFPLSERHIGYNAGVASHLDKMTYRVFLPMLNQVFPFGIWTLVVACHIGVLAILWFSYQSVAKQILDPVCAALSCWAIAASYAGQYGFQDYYLGDSVAVGFLMAAMVTRNSIATSLLIMLGGFTDERAIASAPIILLYHVLRQKDFEENSRIFPLMLVRFIKVGAPVIFGVIAYAAIRLGFTFATGERSGSSMLASFDILRSHFYNDYPQLFFKVFEFLWIFPVLFFAGIWFKKPSQKIHSQNVRICPGARGSSCHGSLGF